jgi:hypothetical protein
LAWAVAVVLCPVCASADPPEPLRVSFQGDGDCASPEGVLEEVLASVPGFREARPQELARTLELSVRATGNESLGELRLVLVDGTRVTATANGSCTQVVDALARVAIRALEPDLPDNPYWPLLRSAEELPENPYWGMLDREASVPPNPYWPWLDCRRAGDCGDVTRGADLPANPYR